jgi:5-hydroxyisourate hydrolase
MAAKDPITCYVLDTTTGRPAANMFVKLLCCTFPDIIFHCNMNSDGRISNWQNSQGSNGAEGAFVESHHGVANTLDFMIKHWHEKDGTAVYPGQRGSSIWKLQFDTGAYYGTDKIFFPVVELSFLVKDGEHFHVPLMLGPYSFTTYRES